MSESKKPVVMVCQKCGLEPFSPPDTAGTPCDGFCVCYFCNAQAVAAGAYEGSSAWENIEGEGEVLVTQEWNARQFRARHEAIDKIVLAIVDYHMQAWIAPDRFGLPSGGGPQGHPAFKPTDTVNEWATLIHDANLARRKAEAKKLLGEAE